MARLAFAAHVRHLPVITYPVLRLAAASLLPTVSDRFLHDMVTDVSPGGKLSNTSATEDPDDAPFRIAWLKQLHADMCPAEELRLDWLAAVGPALRQVLTEQRRRDIAALAEKTLPEAPYPGTPTIVPLRTVADLAREGEEQANCVVDELGAVRRGDVAVYRILDPERATLSLHRTARGWNVGQLLGHANRPVAHATSSVVEEWLRVQSGDPNPELPPHS